MFRKLSHQSDDYYKGKRVFVRVDLNVPIVAGEIMEDYRIQMIIPTIKYLTNRGATVILASHLGRPKGKIITHMSLKPVSERLSQLLGDQVKFVEDCVGNQVNQAVRSLRGGEVILLENLRFHKGEEYNDGDFSRMLSSSADVYVNDAFSASHRKHASVYGMVSWFTKGFAGFVMEKEVQYLTRIRDNPNRPFIVMIGGSKISDKLKALRDLIVNADKVLLGGGVAYTFLKAKGVRIGDSLLDYDSLKWASAVLSEHQDKIHLPEDHVVAKDIQNKASIKTVSGNISPGLKGFDIGPTTAAKYGQIISESRGTVFWNGPLGVFESDEFSSGTVSLAHALVRAKSCGATVVIGGGDTIAALRKANVKDDDVTHISTGGGASMEFLGGEELPGIHVLENV